MREYVLYPPTRYLSPEACEKALRESHKRLATGSDAGARDSAPRTDLVAALLSLGHNSSPYTVKIWTEGARADFPRIPNLNPNHHPVPLRPNPPNANKRGAVTAFSPKSRRNLQRKLGTLKVAEITYTMALTLPGGDQENILPHAVVIESFKTLLRRLSNVADFKAVSGYWKRELQFRGALHYHLLVYGLGCPVLRGRFQKWMVTVWNDLLCNDLSDIQKEHHRWWHARDENMQEVENMTGYFSKYLGKEDENGGLSGRWWGSFNKKSLPVSKQENASLSEKAAVLIHRVARKIRQIKANAGKHRAFEKRLKQRGFKITENALFRMRCGYTWQGHRNPTRAALQLECFKMACAVEGVRPGKFKFRGAIPVQAPIVVCGRDAPTTAAKLVKYAADRLGIPVEFLEVAPKNREDFVPDPLKPVPLGRIPRNPQRILRQADFHAALALSFLNENDFPDNIGKTKN